MPFLCKQLGYVPSVVAQCITCVEEQKPIAGVIYDNYQVKSISAHIWVDTDYFPSREWYGAIFDYPFNRLGVTKIIGQVFSKNEAAMRLDQHFGFTEEGRITDYSEEGSLILYTMTKDQCRILNSPKWARVVDKVARAA
jgi:RimJ/RimL family protein N-acetyltransferase